MKCHVRHDRWWGGIRSAIRALAVVLLIASGAAAQQTPGGPVEPGSARPPAPRTALNTPVIDGHGWIADSESSGDMDGSPETQRTVILHLPPRAGGFEGERGVIRPVVEFAGVVRMTAWWRNRAYFAMAEDERNASGAAGAGGVGGRSVLSIAALRGAGEWYSYQPGDRPEVLASLRGDADLVGFAATMRGPVALLRERLVGEIKPGALAAQPATSLWVLFGERWEHVPAPWDWNHEDAPRAPIWRAVAEEKGTVLRPEGVVGLVDWRGGVGLLTSSQSRDALEAWIGRAALPRVGPMKDVPTVQPALEWTRLVYPLTAAGGMGSKVDVSGGIAFVKARAAADDALLGWAWDEHGVMTITRLRPSGAMVLTSLTDVPRWAKVIPMAAPGQEASASGTLAMVWDSRSAEGGVGGKGESDLRMVREISALTGREMYAGSERQFERQNGRKLQSVVVIVMLMTVGVLVFVLRGDPQVVATLPEKVRLAEPLKRLGAAFLDYAPCAVIVALAQGRSALVLLTPDSILGGGNEAEMDLAPLGMAIGLCILHTTLGEWMFGRSIGKFVLGLRVVSVAGDGAGQGAAVEAEGLVERKPRLWQAAVRNLVRWTVPLMAVFALLDVAGRHPGDLAARTLVVADTNDGS